MSTARAAMEKEMTEWASIVGDVGKTQFEQRIEKLREDAKFTKSIEETVGKAVSNYLATEDKAFVIFGEPQSGKTEMMIALNAKLLDEECQVIINLLPDSVDLLEQNLARFRLSGLSPSPKNYSELPDDPKSIADKQWVLFCKKNARDLDKLLERIRFVRRVVIIDDEADYASPNAKINIEETTKINELINDLLKDRGIYIGVTATPARLDLNNTFDNVPELWVNFDPHPGYVGQEFFFPSNGLVEYKLHQFPLHTGNERQQLREAVLHFLCGVADQHLNKHRLQNYAMIIHTSGKIDEHNEDVRVLQETIDVLSTPHHKRFTTSANLLERIADDYGVGNAKQIAEYVLRNINRHQITVLNSRARQASLRDIATPTSFFSFVIGGNIISRGVTFDNLLSMYFTRGVKGKFTQDTYIQRARMFGSREAYKESFQLWIPEALMQDWAKCFAFHQLAIASIKSNYGAPVWLSDHKVTPTSAASINRASVDFEDGEMSWGLFQYQEAVHEPVMLDNKLSDLKKLQKLGELLSESEFPPHIRRYLEADARLSEGSICFHHTSVFGERSRYPQEEIANVRRRKGVFSTNEFNRGRRPTARHHLKIFRNREGMARLFYKINGQSVKFMQNRR